MANNRKLIFIYLFLLIIVGIAIFLTESEKGGCLIRSEERIVRGNSLQGLIEDGETVKILFGYYDCHDIIKEDVIAYSFAGNEEPLIKIVKGIPGDKFAFQKMGDGWHILINEKILKNSKNQAYLLDEGGYNMLSLYEKDYQGVIPEQTFLIMGNLTSGVTDSVRFGLAHRNDILGKAEALRR